MPLQRDFCVDFLRCSSFIFPGIHHYLLEFSIDIMWAHFLCFTVMAQYLYSILYCSHLVCHSPSCRVVIHCVAEPLNQETVIIINL